MEPFEIVQRLALIRLALEVGDIGAAEKHVAEFHAEALCELLPLAQRGEAQPTATAPPRHAGRVQTPESALAAAVRNRQYDDIVEEMTGPPCFSLIVAGATESRPLISFHHTPCSDDEYERLLAWLSRTPELGQLLSAVLERSDEPNGRALGS